MTSPPFAPAARAGLALCTGLVLAGLVLLGARAGAIFVEAAETGRPGYLSLRTDPGHPHWHDFAPGRSATWQIEANLADAEEGELTIELRATGSMVAEGLTVSVERCDAPFAANTCTGRGAPVIAPTPVAEIATPTAGDVFELPPIEAGHPQYVLLTLHRPLSPATAVGASARVGVGFHAAGSSPSGSHPAAVTGVDLTGMGLVAAGLVGAGALALRRGAPARRPDSGGS